MENYRVGGGVGAGVGVGGGGGVSVGGGVLPILSGLILIILLDEGRYSIASFALVNIKTLSPFWALAKNCWL